MLLVDTSVLILTSRSDVSLEELFPFDEFAICLPIVQEVLQGTRNERVFRLVRDSLLALPILENPMSEDVFVEAAHIYHTGRKLGFTIRSANDCLIAACAIRAAVPLLHADRDFDTIARFTSLEARNVMQ